MPNNTKQIHGLIKNWTAWVVIWMVLWVIGCVSLDQIVPPVDQMMIDYGQNQGVSDRSLLVGRQTYLNRCIGCHSVEPVDRYSLEQWEVIVPEMATEAKLSGVQTADLFNYIRTARQYVDMPKPDLLRDGD